MSRLAIYCICDEDDASHQEPRRDCPYHNAKEALDKINEINRLIDPYKTVAEFQQAWEDLDDERRDLIGLLDQDLTKIKDIITSREWECKNVGNMLKPHCASCALYEILGIIENK